MRELVQTDSLSLCEARQGEPDAGTDVGHHDDVEGELEGSDLCNGHVEGALEHLKERHNLPAMASKGRVVVGERDEHSALVQWHPPVSCSSFVHIYIIHYTD